jgi:hypothetical protein
MSHLGLAPHVAIRELASSPESPVCISPVARRHRQQEAAAAAATVPNSPELQECLQHVSHPAALNARSCCCRHALAALQPAVCHCVVHCRLCVTAACCVPLRGSLSPVCHCSLLCVTAILSTRMHLSWHRPRAAAATLHTSAIHPSSQPASSQHRQLLVWARPHALATSTQACLCLSPACTPAGEWPRHVHCTCSLYALIHITTSQLAAPGLLGASVIGCTAICGLHSPQPAAPSPAD